MDFIHCFDADYSPLGNVVTIVDRINKLMLTFPETMEMMNEKKKILISSFPDRVKKVTRKIGFTPSIGAGQLTIQKRPCYTNI